MSETTEYSELLEMMDEAVRMHEQAEAIARNTTTISRTTWKSKCLIAEAEVRALRDENAILRNQNTVINLRYKKERRKVWDYVTKLPDASTDE